MARWMIGRSIGFKILVSFAMIIVLLMGVAGISFFSLQSISESFTKSRVRLTEGDLTRDIDYLYLDLRRKVDAYVAYGKAEARAEADKAVATVAASIDAARKGVTEPQRATQIEEIAKQFETYKSVWVKVAELKEKQSSIVQQTVEPIGIKLKSDAGFIAAKLLTIGKPELLPIITKGTEQYNAGRVAVVKLMTSADDKDLKEADAGFAGFEQRLNLLVKQLGPGQESSGIGKVLKSVATFKDAYHQAQALNVELSGLINNEMKNVSSSIATAVVAVREDAAREAEAIGTATVSLAASVRQIVLIGAAVSILVSIILAVVIGRSISRPVVAIAEAMRRVSEGALDIKVPGVGRGDEVGTMADTLEVFKTNLAEAEAQRVARDADSQAAIKARRKELHDLADMFEQSVGGIATALASSSTQLNGAARIMTRSSSEATHKTSVVAEASEEASASVGTVAAAAEELASSISEIGRQVNESTEIAARAVNDASDTAAKVGALSEAAKKIGNVVDLINNIAGQTNLLALNATIEAARAGEAGKGFAVVAAEVKQLADQTAKATNEIGAQIAAIQASTAQSSEAIFRITETIGQIADVSSAVQGAVHDQGTATQEIANSVQRAASSTNAVTANITEVNEAARHSAAAADEVLHASEALSDQARRLQEELNIFLRTVRAA